MAPPSLGEAVSPTVFLDVSTTNDAESALFTAVCSRAPEVIATVPAGDERTLCFFRDQAKYGVVDLDALRETDDGTNGEKDGSLARLQRRLFVEGLALAESTVDDEVTVISAPGGGRECAEVARRILDAARQGVPFDRMAVLLRSPEEYRSHLEEAFARAGIPAHFAKGSIRPDPSGRAFYVLLTCAAEGLSARRFAEYLSLAQVPDATADGAPPGPEPLDQSTGRYDEAALQVSPDQQFLDEQAGHDGFAGAGIVGPAGNPTADTGASHRRQRVIWCGNASICEAAANLGQLRLWPFRLRALRQSMLPWPISRTPSGPSLTTIERPEPSLARSSAFIST
jgi:hypothetical protein